jgi:methyl-accepting chemotaxis protein
MFSFFQNASIKQKIIGGFTIVIILLIVVGGVALRSFIETRNNVQTVVDQNQPVVLAAQELETSLKAAVASMGFYMLGRDDASLEAYENDLGRLQEAMDELTELPLVEDDPEYQELAGKISMQVMQFFAYHDEVLRLASAYAERMPAIVISDQKLNPSMMAIRQSISEMINSEMEEEVSEERRELLQIIYDLRYSVANLMIGFRGYVAFNDRANYENSNLYKKKIQGLINQLNERVDEMTFEQQEALDIINPEYEKVSQGVDELFEVHGSEKAYLDIYLQKTEIIPLVNDTSETLKELVDLARNTIIATSQELTEQVETAERIIMILVAVGVLLGIVIAASVVLGILGPLNQAIAAMQDIAEGEGDLTQKLNEKGGAELKALGRAFNLFVDKIRETVSQTAEAVDRLAQVSGRMSAITEETVMGVDQQNSETERAATAMTEMASTSVEVAEHARGAAQAANDADGSAHEGQAVVEETMKSINALAVEVDKAGEVIASLQQDSIQIGSILDVIRSIAEQTNLLALNAAIEAAAAGEQGRGFAVVADEVRTLASRTQDSTQEIQAMIERLQKSSEEAVNVMGNGRSLAEQTVDQAGQTRVSLDTITHAVNSISEMNASISVAADEQSKVADEINRNIVTISDISHQSAKGSNEIAQHSEELTRLAQTLKVLVGGFRT